MPALTKKHIEELAVVLRQQKSRLLEEIRVELARSGEQHYIDLASRVAEQGDQSVADMLADIDVAMANRQIKEVHDIEAALERIESREYGECIGCGANIAHNRLLAYPTAKRCIRCQELHEKQYAEEIPHSL